MERRRREGEYICMHCEADRAVWTCYWFWRTGPHFCGLMTSVDLFREQLRSSLWCSILHICLGGWISVLWHNRWEAEHLNVFGVSLL